MSGCQFVTSSSSALGLCSRTMIPNTPASWFWPSQSPDLNPIEMWWHDLKQSFHAWKPSNVAELKQFCKEEWAKIPPQRCERLIASYRKLQLLLQRVAQPVIRFRGQFVFHVGPGRFGQLFSLNKWNHYFKTAFCIYTGYICVIYIFFLMIWIIQVWQICKKKKNRKGGEGGGQKLFHTTVDKSIKKWWENSSSESIW